MEATYGTHDPCAYLYLSLCLWLYLCLSVPLPVPLSPYGFEPPRINIWKINQCHSTIVCIGLSLRETSAPMTSSGKCPFRENHPLSHLSYKRFVIISFARWRPSYCKSAFVCYH